MSIPKVFISNSHDSLEHKKWVLELATRLRTNVVDAILDQWELTAGSDVPHFMEQNLVNSDFIIMICTNNYVEKANKGTGGVGYEKMIVTGSLMKNINESKVIPIVRQAGDKKVPTFLSSKLYIDFSKQDEFEFAYDELIRAIHQSPIFKKPPIGDNPFSRIDAKPIEPQKDPIKEIMQIFVDSYEKDKEALNFDNLQSELNISRVMLQYLLTKMLRQGLIRHVNHGRFDYYQLLDAGITYGVESGLVK